MPTYSAGQEIDAFCTRCKMDLLHKIIAVAGGKPARVECRTCYGTHTYRPVKGVKSPGAAPIAQPASARASGPRAPTARARAAPEPELLSPPAGAPIHSYRVTERYAADVWISHKTFGIGRVLREVPPDKIEVRFNDTTRTLVHGHMP